MSRDLAHFFFAEGNDLNFFQAVSLLESLYPNRPPVGTSPRVNEEIVTFQSSNTFGFQQNDIGFILPEQPSGHLQLAGDSHWDGESGLPTASTGKVRMGLSFLGIYGAHSPLPSVLNEALVMDKEEYHKLCRFLDLFGHRIYSLFYRSWKRSRCWVVPRPSVRNPLLTGLAILGNQDLTLSREHQKGALRNIALFRFLQSQRRSPADLERLLTTAFGFPRVKIYEFLVGWVSIPRKAILGKTARVGTPTGEDGLTARIGETMQVCLNRFLIEIGPLSRPQYDALRQNSGGSRVVQVRKLVDRFLRDSLEYQIRVVLDTSQEPPTRLGSGSTLGTSAWLGDRPVGSIFTFM